MGDSFKWQMLQGNLSNCNSMPDCAIVFVRRIIISEPQCIRISKPRIFHGESVTFEIDMIILLNDSHGAEILYVKCLCNVDKVLASSASSLGLLESYNCKGVLQNPLLPV